jgi:hypothetical protein
MLVLRFIQTAQQRAGATKIHEFVKTFPRKCANEVALKRENATLVVAFSFRVGEN